MVKDEEKKKIRDDSKRGEDKMKTDNVKQKSKASRKREISTSDSANVSIDMSKKVKVTSDSDSGIDDVDPEKLDKRKVNITIGKLLITNDSDGGTREVGPGNGKYNNRKIKMSSDHGSEIDDVDPDRLGQGKVNITIGKLI